MSTSTGPTVGEPPTPPTTTLPPTPQGQLLQGRYQLHTIMPEHSVLPAFYADQQREKPETFSVGWAVADYRVSGTGPEKSSLDCEPPEQGFKPVFRQVGPTMGGSGGVSDAFLRELEVGKNPT